MTGKSLSYKQSCVDYDLLDPIKKLAQTLGFTTARNLSGIKFKEVKESRGETAYIIEANDCFYAFVQEGLGTKNLVADEVRKITGKTYYDVVAHDTVATFINDISTVGAKPLVVHAFWSVEDNSFLQDADRTKDFITGWKNACNIASATWGGGETSTSKGIILPETINLAGSCVGVIPSEKRLLIETKLKNGDRILLLRSNCIN